MGRCRFGHDRRRLGQRTCGTAQGPGDNTGRWLMHARTLADWVYLVLEIINMRVLGWRAKEQLHSKEHR